MAKGKSPVKLRLESSSYAIGDNQYNKKAHNLDLKRRAANLPGKQNQKDPEQRSEQGISRSHPGARYASMGHTNYLRKQVESFENELKIIRQRSNYQSAKKKTSGESKLEYAYNQRRLLQSFCKTGN